MTANHHTRRACRAFARVSSLTLTRTLGERLLDVVLAAEPRADVDDDLDLIRDITEQVTTICHDVLDHAQQYQARSFKYRLHRFTAAMSFTSNGYTDLQILDELIEMCQRLPHGLARRYRVAEGYADGGWPQRVRHCRTTVLDDVWFHAGRCLRREEN